jgi:glycosyltransferase involved in cell wall biosynthesis
MIVVHLVPYNGVGGVEAAARSFLSGHYGSIRFSKYFLASHSRQLDLMAGDSGGPFGSENDLRNLIQALVWLRRQRPRLLIASLWRSYVVLLLHKLLRPSCLAVCFLHCDRAVHLVDWLMAFGAMAIAEEIWTDSDATLRARVPKVWHRKSLVISFVLKRVDPVTRERPIPRFLFWGRLAPQKNLDLSLHIIALLHRVVRDVQFQVIGPDQGERLRLEQLANQLKLGAVVSFLGQKSQDEIAAFASQASFYLQTSVFEGMAVSVMEAMQFGLVPVVTPVGQISSYCRDGFNALVIKPDDSLDVVHRIQHLISAPSRYGHLRQRAISTWAGASTYSDDVFTRCQTLVNR